MKKLLLLFALSLIIQHSFAQDSTGQFQLSQLLLSYYGIKDALVAGNPVLASTHAGQFVKTANGIDYKIISEGNINTLLKDAGEISESRNIKQQRQLFANFSANMSAVARSVKLTTVPVYEQYCPMKKAYWLSSDKAIKNPYYGSTMLTCGKVTAILQ